MSDITTKPVHRIRYGNVSLSIFLHNSQSGYFYDTTALKVYKNGDVWNKSSTFDDRDLLNLSKAAADAFSWIYQQKANAVTVNGNDVA